MTNGRTALFAVGLGFVRVEILYVYMPDLLYGLINYLLLITPPCLDVQTDLTLFTQRTHRQSRCEVPDCIVYSCCND